MNMNKFLKLLPYIIISVILTMTLFLNYIMIQKQVVIYDECLIKKSDMNRYMDAVESFSECGEKKQIFNNYDYCNDTELREYINKMNNDILKLESTLKNMNKKENELVPLSQNSDARIIK